MPTKLIQLEEGVLVEVEVTANQTEQLSGSFADKVNSSIDRIESVLTKIARPVVNSWKEINQEMYVEHAEIEVGLSFEGEGNLYVTKSKVAANITVKLLLKPPPSK